MNTKLSTLVLVLLILPALSPLAPGAHAQSPSAPSIPALTLDVVGSRSLPDSLAVTVPYSIAANPFTSWSANDELVSLRVTRSGLAPEVELVTSGPVGRESVRIPGLLKLEGDPSGTWQALVEENGVRRLAVSGNFLASSPYVTVEGMVAGTPLHLHLDAVNRIRFSIDGDAVAYTFENPLAGLLLDTYAGLHEHLVALLPRDDGMTLDMLGERRRLETPVLRGNPLGDGLRAIDPSTGEVLLHLRTIMPKSANDALVIDASGSAVSTIAERFDKESDRVTIHVMHVGVVTPPVLALWTSAKDEIRGATTFEPTTGARLVDVTLPGDGHAYVEIPPALTHVRLGTGAAALHIVASSSSSSLGVDVLHNGRSAYAIEGTALPAKVTARPGAGFPDAKALVDDAPSAVQPPITLHPDALEGTITALLGDASNPSGFVLSTLSGLPIAAFLPEGDGLEALLGGDVGTISPAPSITFNGDPLGAGAWGATIGNAAAVEVAPRTLDGAPLGLAKITLEILDVQGIESGTRVVLDPVVLVYDEVGKLDAIVMSLPSAPDTDLLRLDTGDHGITLHTILGSHDLGAGTLVLDGAPDKDRFRASVMQAGAAIASLDVDRREQPPRVTFTGAGETLTAQAPLILKGDPSDPDAFAVLDTTTGESLLHYERKGDRGTLRVAGEEHTAHLRTFTIEGDLLGSRGMNVIARGPDGAVLHAYRIDASLAFAALAPAQAHLTPYLEGAAAVKTGPRLLYVEGLDVRVAASSLDGGTWISPRQGLDVVLSPADPEPYGRVHLHYARGSNASIADASVPFARQADGSWRATLTPQDLIEFRSGNLLSMLVAYERSISPAAKLVDSEPERLSGYLVRLDSSGPSAQMVAPDEVDGFIVPITLSGSDADSGIARYEIAWRHPNDAWTTWSVEERVTTFSGERGREYELRARAIDRAGNAGAWTDAARVRTLAFDAENGSADGTNDHNRPPIVTFLAPEPNAALKGIAPIAWSASDPDGTTPSVRLELSRDSGRTWTLLYTGTQSSHVWNTLLEPDGDNHRLRITATDGSLQSMDALAGIRIANGPSSPGGGSGHGGGNGSGDAAGNGDDWNGPADVDGPLGSTGPTLSDSKTDAAPEEKRKFLGIPAAGGFLAAASLLGVALFLARRRN